jgi:cyclin-dependent kinase
VFEYLDTDLKKFMDRTGRGPSNPLPKLTVQAFMYQLLKGVAHIHRHGVMHRCARRPSSQPWERARQL